MNPIQAAEQLKNLSDQQLMSAGQNPVAVPPYLVLAEMKRREQLRAEYAKAQQGQQQQQPPVIQQVAQNLAQGQPQQPQQQPQAQGIMQAMPQGAVGMAGGGHVARYADKGRVSESERLGVDPSLELMRQLGNVSMARPKPPSSNREALRAEFAGAYQMPGIQDKIAAAQSLLGAPDYSEYEEFLKRQRGEAESRKVRLGDALIAAGAAMASNRDPRVGLAGILAQGIGAGSQAYREAEEKKKKDVQASMLASMALKNVLQQDKAKQIELASQMASAERGNAISMMQMIESRIQREQEAFERAQTEFDRFNAQKNLEALKAQLNYYGNLAERASRFDLAKMEMAGRENIARIGASARTPSSNPRLSALSSLVKTGQDRLKDIEDQLSKPLIRRDQEKLKSLTAERQSLVRELGRNKEVLSRMIAESGGGSGGEFVRYTEE